MIPLSAHSQLLDQLREGHVEEQQNLRAALEAANARSEVLKGQVHEAQMSSVRAAASLRESQSHMDLRQGLEEKLSLR